MEEKKEYYLMLKGKKTAVTEEVYRTCKQAYRREKKQKQRMWRCLVPREKGSKVFMKRCTKNCKDCEYAQNGKVVAKGKYANDLKEGKWVFYNVQEVKVREQNFIHDIPNGTFTEYYNNGKKHFQGQFKNHLREGKWSCWKPDGKLHYSALFSNGNKVKDIFVSDPKSKPF